MLLAFNTFLSKYSIQEMKTYINKYLYTDLPLLLMCLLISHLTWGQCGGVVQDPNMISGPTSPTAGTSQTYTTTTPGSGSLLTPSWSIKKGSSNATPNVDYTISYAFSNTTAYITWLRGGSYSVKVVVPRQSGSCFTNYEDTNNITVSCPNTISTPTVSTDPYTTFTNCSVTLQVNQVSGLTYRWYDASTGGTLLHTGASYSYTNGTAGNYAVYVEADDGCQSTTRRQVNITVNAIATPTISVNNSEIFLGESITLTVTNPQSGYTYTWYQSGNGTPLSTGSSYSFSPGAAGTFNYYAQAEVCTGNTLNSATVGVSVRALPVITSSVSADPVSGNILLCPGAFTDLSLSGSYSGATYQWNRNGTPITGETSTTLSNVSATGDYTLTVTLSGGSSATSAPIRIVNNEYGDNNYIISRTLLVKETDANQIETKPIGEMIESVTFYDGLGRPIQQVGVGLSPNGRKDIVSPIAYDEFGRTPRSYLPYVDVDDLCGTFKPNAIDPNTYTNSDQYQFYQNTTLNMATDTRPFAEVVYEPSPRSRVLRAYGVGQNWTPDDIINPQNIYEDPSNGANHFTESDYQIYNTTVNEPVLLWEYDFDATTAATEFIAPTNYQSGQLIITEIIDEEGSRIRQFTNKLGQTVLKQAFNEYDNNGNGTIEAAEQEILETYYIYDDFGQLRLVIPPMGVSALRNPDGTFQNWSAGLSTAIIQTWCFRYDYDQRHRLIEKESPQTDPSFVVYDELDRVVAIQDAEQDKRNEWSFTKYDDLNRPVMTGLLSTTADRATLQGDANTAGVTYQSHTPDFGDAAVPSQSYPTRWLWLYPKWQCQRVPCPDQSYAQGRITLLCQKQ